jgi:hypothetical protein
VKSLSPEVRVTIRTHKSNPFSFFIHPQDIEEDKAAIEEENFEEIESF